MDPTPWHGKPAPPSKIETPRDPPLFLTSSRGSNHAFFFSLVFLVSLRVTAPSVMRNGRWAPLPARRPFQP